MELPGLRWPSELRFDLVSVLRFHCPKLAGLLRSDGERRWVLKLCDLALRIFGREIWSEWGSFNLCYLLLGCSPLLPLEEFKVVLDP